MIYLLLAAAVFAFLVWLGRRSAARRADWRTPAALLGLAVLVAGAAAALRGAYVVGLALVAVGITVAASARRVGPARPRQEAPPPPARMTAAEARAVLGVDAQATPDEIKAAHLRLMRAVHPDRGGTAGLASQLNAARDRLLERP